MTTTTAAHVDGRKLTLEPRRAELLRPRPDGGLLHARPRHDGERSWRGAGRYGAPRLPHHRSVRAPSARAGVGTDGGRDPRRAGARRQLRLGASSSSRSGSSRSRHAAPRAAAPRRRGQHELHPASTTATRGRSTRATPRATRSSSSSTARGTSTSRAVSSSISRSTTPRSSASTEELCRATGDCQPYEEWRAEIARRIADDQAVLR